MAGRNLKLYYERWKALDGLIRGSYQIYLDGPDFDRKATILYLLKCLQAFGWGQFQFFYYGFALDDSRRSAQDPLLQVWEEYPPEDILTAVLGQIGHDLDLFQRAANQRLVGDQTMRDTLINADKLAWLALQPAAQHQVIDKPATVLTYFEKAAESYSIPYAPIAVIAIPFTAAMEHNYQDLLSIPHEAGHYVYRHPAKDARDVLRALPDNSRFPSEYRQWIKRVLEELCADIYACLIAGPVMAVDFASLSLGNSQADFRGGDDLHPNPALRPLIYSQVLAHPAVRQLTVDDWSPIAGLLAAQWDSQLLERHVDEFIITNTRQEGLNKLSEQQPHNIAASLKPVLKSGDGGGHGSLGDVVKIVVDVMIKSLLAYINRNGPVDDPHDLKGWAGPVDGKTKPAELLPHFDDWAKETFGQDVGVPQAPPSDDPLLTDFTNHTSPLWVDWIKRTNKPAQGPWRWPPADPVLSGEVKNADKLQPGTWGFIQYADGWSVGGPGIDHGQPAI